MKYKSNAFRSQRRMFPKDNVHYRRNFAIGFPSFHLNKLTEYKLQYSVSSNKSFSINNKHDLNDVKDMHKSNESVVKDLESKSCEYGLDDNPLKYYVRKKAYYKLNDEYSKTPSIIRSRPTRIKETLCTTISEANQHPTLNPLNHKKSVSQTISKKEVASIELNNVENDIRSTVVDNIIQTKIRDKTLYTSDENTKSLNEERRNRALKYKKSLDTQILIKNEKQRYEKLSKKKSMDLLYHRSKELKEQEKELQLNNKALKKHLADIYKQQIEEQKSTLIPSKDKDDFCSILESNRKSYLKVIL